MVNPEIGRGPEEQPQQENPYLKTRDIYRENATELQRGVAEIQAAKYETTLYKLMSRTGDNSELIRAMNEFLGEIDHQSAFGEEEKPLPPARIKRLVKFFEEGKEKLWSAGGE